MAASILSPASENPIAINTFAGLPTELIYMVADQLEPCDLFGLSRTCSRMRAIVHRDWDALLAKSPQNHRLNFWTSLARQRPNHWVCLACCKLHPIAEWDVPGFTAFIVGRSYSWTNQQQPVCQAQAAVAPYSLAWTACIREMHIQLALKLTRMTKAGGTAASAVNRKYLKRLTAPFEAKILSGYSAPNTSFARATPRIVGGRFLLRIESRYWDGSENSTAPERNQRPNSLQGFLICPHRVCLPVAGTMEVVPIPEDRLVKTRTKEDAEILAGNRPTFSAGGFDWPWEKLNQELRLACDRGCPLDYAVTLHSGGATLRAWYDFGSEKSPGDEEWKTSHDWSQRAHAALGLDVSPGHALKHVPGSVRRMFESEGSPQAAINKSTADGNAVGASSIETIGQAKWSSHPCHWRW